LTFKERKQLETQYHKDQAEVELFLYNFRDHFDKQPHFKTMFQLDSPSATRPDRIKSGKHIEVFRMVSELLNKTMALLRKAITNREKAHQHYLDLPSPVPPGRTEGSHLNFIEILKAGEAMLLGSRCPQCGTKTVYPEQVVETGSVQTGGWQSKQKRAWNSGRRNVD
jgi:hypothetical protein